MNNNVTYFAYGSNMPEHIIMEITPGATIVGIARLADHRLAFTRRSVRWDAGVADIVECPGLSVYGVLYSIPADELPELDQKEGAPKAYEQVKITVLMDHKPLQVMTYTVVKPEANEIRPHVDYLRQLREGAEEHGLPGSYVAFLDYLDGQFAAGTRGDGLLLTPTLDRKFSAGEPLIRLNRGDCGKLRHGSFGVLLRDDKSALGKVEITDAIPAGTCQADQVLRASLGVSGQFCFGHRVTVMQCGGAMPKRSIIDPRALVLPTYAISHNDSEKNYCVLHPDRIKALGLQEGEYARLFVAISSGDANGRAITINAVSMRVFTGSADTVKRGSDTIQYPRRSELYLDKDTRKRLGFPESGWQGIPVLLRPALWKALSGRAVFYGLTILLGIGAVFQLLQAYAPRLKSGIDATIALVISAAITMVVSIIDLRSRFRY